MHPDIVKIGPVAIHSYGLMLALAFATGVVYLKTQSRREKLNFNIVLNLAFIVLIVGVIGARLGYVILHMGEFSENIIAIFNPFHNGQFGISGMNLMGGIITAIPAAIIYIYVKMLPLPAMLDLLAPPVALGTAIGRVGCFLNGCCFGFPTDSVVGCTFPHDAPASLIFGEVPVHPAQLYMAAYNFLLFVAAHFMLRNKRFDGMVFAYFLILMSILRFAVEYIRWYEDAMLFAIFRVEFTYNQLGAVAMAIIGISVLLWAPRKLFREEIGAASGH